MPRPLHPPFSSPTPETKPGQPGPKSRGPAGRARRLPPPTRQNEAPPSEPKTRGRGQSAPAAAAEHLPQHLHALPQVGGAEEHPSDERQDEGQRRPDRVGPTPFVRRRALAAQGPLDGEQRSLIAAPDQKIPTGAVP